MRRDCSMSSILTTVVGMGRIIPICKSVIVRENGFD